MTRRASGTTTLEWIGHAAVLVTAADGTRILFDPYESGGFDGRIAYAPIEQRVEVVVVTHDHLDHCHVTPANGEPHIVDRTCRVGDLGFVTVLADHDDRGGAISGQVRVTAVEVDGLRIVHLSDLGVPLGRAQVAALGGRPDLVLAPVGGTYTVDALGAAVTIARLAPAAAVPIHYLTPRCTLPMAPVEPFLDEAARRGWPVERVGGSQLSLRRAPAADTPRILVLEPSH